MSETIEIDDVHDFMLDQMADGSEEKANVVENLIYQAHQIRKQAESADEAEDE